MFVSKELILLLLLAYGFTHILSKRLPMRLFSLISRWCRWFAVACIFSLALTFFAWSNRPDWVHVVSGLALWFILETLFFRISIHLLSVSEMELFPKYKNDSDDNLWPVNKAVFNIKALLSEEGFKFKETLKAELMPQITIRQAIFFDAAKTIRLNVLFVPNAQNEVQLFFSLLSTKANGDHVISDNQNMPFGGYYPEHWSVNRYPMCHSLKTLLKNHRERMDQEDDWSPIDGDVRTITNRLQWELERKNREMGFLLSPNSENKQRISSDGCFRIWTEMWLLSYFGKTLA